MPGVGGGRQGNQGGSGAPRAQGHTRPRRTGCGTARAHASLDLFLAVSGEKAFLQGEGGRGSDARTGSLRSRAGRWRG